MTAQVAHLAETAVAVAAAKAAGLRHVDDRRPGLRRRRTGRQTKQGKRATPEFAIADAHGRVVTDEATLARVRKLAIPPAWKDVWICADAAGHLQATGRDARGRKQYRYHARWREERDSTKFYRLIEFARALPGLRRKIAADLRLPGLPRRKVLATVVKLLETTFIRVGNEEYARQNNSFGLTTLKDRHVDFHHSEVRFHFRGKSGVRHDISVHDPSIARIVRRCRDLPGQELFQYVQEDRGVGAIDSTDVNNYIRELAGHDFTAKDFRTWAGTVLAASALREVAATAKQHRPGGGGRGPSARAGGPARPNSKDVVRAIERVARRLGNTPSVCRKCYVHPHVVASYLDGTLTAALARVSARTSRGAKGLHADEAGVLALLRQRSTAERRGTLLANQLERSLKVVHRAVPRPSRRAKRNAPAPVGLGA